MFSIRTMTRKVYMNIRPFSSFGSAIDADLLDRARKWDLAEKDHEEKTRLHKKRMGDSVHKLKEKRQLDIDAGRNPKPLYQYDIFYDN